MSRVVTHVTQAFVRWSESWLYDIVTAPTSYEARVLTRWPENEQEFPVERLELLDDRNPRGSALWFQHQLHHRLGWPPTPANLWRDSLRELAGEPDLFHAHYGWVGWRSVEAGLTPVVTSFYGVDASGRQELAEWRSAYRRLFRSGAAFVALGPVMRDRLVGLGAPAERTHVVPLVVRLEDDWTPAAVADSTPPRVLMAGRLVEKKGFADGVAAFAEARRAGIEARLAIMGSGPEEERIRAAVRAHGLDDDVEFVPPQPRAEFRDHLRSCQILLQPSRTAGDGDSEGTPATILDAQALGRVVVTTDHCRHPGDRRPRGRVRRGRGRRRRARREPGGCARRAGRMGCARRGGPPLRRGEPQP